MKNNDYFGMILPICMGLGVALGVALDQLTWGVAIGGGVGCMLSLIGVFHNKEDNNGVG